MNHKSIVLFGGSFNPPHLGHLIVIEQAFELIPHSEELWLLPCNQHTFNKSLAPAKHRLTMCKLLINEAVEACQQRRAQPDAFRQPSTSLAHAELPKLKIKLCKIEIDQNLSGSTYETLQLLKSKYPDHHFSFLIGSDQLPVFIKWKNFLKLLEELPFFVYPRANYPMKPLYPGMTALSSPTQVITNISSTLIRKRLAANLPVSHLLPPSIAAHLTHHPLVLK